MTIHRSPFSRKDDIGYVYFEDERVFRSVNQENVQQTYVLITSKLLKTLTERGLVPRTKIHTYDETTSTLILEHERVAPCIYPFEWSPEMVRRAALTIIEINEIANQFGYELKDSHPFNVMFRGPNPTFVDIGSIVPRLTKTGWTATSEFERCFLYPLKSYASGMHHSFRRAYLYSSGIPFEEYVITKHPTLRCLGPSRLKQLCHAYSDLRNIDEFQDEQIERRFHSRLLRKIFRFAQNRDFPFKRFRPNKLRRKINSLKLSTVTEWGDYHQRSGFYESTGSTKLSERFKRILELINEYQPNSVIDIAGNQGVLAREIAKIPSVKHVICGDLDEQAIDQLIRNLNTNECVYPANFNFMGEVWQNLAQERAPRLRSDFVLALALTHHLILTQRYTLDSIIKGLINLSNRYIMVEFMPLGLWTRDKPTRPTPDYYTLEWFRSTLEKHASILLEEQVSENRILFIAEK